MFWCTYNLLDINWKKTFFMFISNNNSVLPSEIIVNNISIKVVNTFKLLGVIIDSKLNFLHHASNVCISVNRKLFAIKRLFYLDFDVKIQFFKTFILPYFDYCATLYIYFNKTAIIKIYKCYLFCLYKLFNFSIHNFNGFFEFHNYLEYFNLPSFQSRFIKKLCHFIHNIVTNHSPIQLFDSLDFQNDTVKYYNLRSSNLLTTHFTRTYTGDLTFSNFFTKFINSILGDDIFIDNKLFSVRMNNNNILLLQKLEAEFPKFKLQT